MSLIELLVTTALMGLTMAAVGEMVVLNTTASTRLTNSVDGQLGCSRAISRIAEDIRRSSVIGTMDGTNSFNGFSLGTQTLILQQPAYFEDSSSSGAHANLNGFPMFQSVGSFNPAYVTVIYALVADQNNPGSSILQVSRYVGGSGMQTTYLPTLSSQTVLTGIIGPTDTINGGIMPFQYLTQANGTTVNSNTATPPYWGVSINFEVQTPVSGKGLRVQHSTAHVESYLKTAINSRVTN